MPVPRIAPSPSHVYVYVNVLCTMYNMYTMYTCPYRIYKRPSHVTMLYYVYNRPSHIDSLFVYINRLHFTYIYIYIYIGLVGVVLLATMAQSV